MLEITLAKSFCWKKTLMILKKMLYLCAWLRDISSWFVIIVKMLICC